MKPLAWLALAAAPLLAYPAGAAAWFAVDAVAGERLVLHHIAHERRLLLDTFIADYRAALPAALLVTALLLAGAWALARRTGLAVAAWLPPAGGAIAGFAAAFGATGTWFGVTHAALVVAGAAWGLPAAFALRHLLRPRSPESA